ncbi:MAG: TetR family transcriptional regulator [Actinomycetota bacterium]
MKRLLRCTSELLESKAYRDLTVIEIARCAGTSPATFYQYFPDVEAAVLVLANDMSSDVDHLIELLEPSKWSRKNAVVTARELTDGFLDMWNRNRAVLRVVDLATLEGDLRFQNIRTRLLNQVTEALAQIIQPRNVEPLPQAATIVSMLAHVASHQYGFEFWGIRMSKMRDSLTRFVYWGVTGKQPHN